MSATQTLGKRTVPGADTLQTVNIALDNSYPAGGYAIDMTAIGLGVLRRIIAVRPANFASGAWIYTTDLTATTAGDAITAIKLRARVPSTNVEAATGADLSTATVHLVLEGN